MKKSTLEYWDPDARYSRSWWEIGPWPPDYEDHLPSEYGFWDRKPVFSWQIVGSGFPRIEAGQGERAWIFGGVHTYYVSRQYLVILWDLQHDQYCVTLRCKEEKFKGVKAKQKSSLVDQASSMRVDDGSSRDRIWVAEEQLKQALGRQIADELDRRRAEQGG